MAADGGVSFAVKLVNDVTGPAKAMQRSMKDVQKTFESAQKAMAAPAPKRGGMSDWDKSVAKARRSQVADFAREQKRLVRVTAAEHVKASKLVAAREIKEQKRVADFKSGMAQTSLDNKMSMAGGLGGSVLQMGTVGAVAGAAAVGYLGYQFGKASVEAAAFGERSRMALTLLTGSATVAQTEFDAVRKDAVRLGLDVQDTQLGFQKLLAAQFDIGKAKELIGMSADLQAIGASADQTKRAIVAISQIKNTGYLQGDELNQLREAGLSTELIYESLGKKLGKSTAQIIDMQEKRQLGSADVIESILEAVRIKTGTKKAGDAGELAAATTISGMARVFGARVQNAFINIGDAILPGLKKLGAMAMSFIDKLAADPKVAALGQFMLDKFQTFVVWVELNWPQITETLTTGVYTMIFALEVIADLFDTSTLKGAAFYGMLGLLAVAFAVVALGGFMAMLPLYLAIGLVGLLAYGFWQVIVFIYDQLAWLYNKIAGLFGAGTASAESPVAVTTAAESGPAARMANVLSGVATPPTVAAEPQGALAASNVFNFDIKADSMTDKAAIAAAARSAVTKALTEHA